MDYAFYRIAQMARRQALHGDRNRGGGLLLHLPEVLRAPGNLGGDDPQAERRPCSWRRSRSDNCARVPNFEILKENIPNMIYLPNSDAINNLALYQDDFRADAAPDRDDFRRGAEPRLPVGHADQTRMLQARFPKEALAYLRSDGRAQAMLDKHVKSGVDNWQDAYVRDVLANAYRLN